MIELLCPGDDLRVAVAPHAPLPARVEAVDGDRVVAASLVPLPALPGAFPGRSAEVAYTTRRGLHRAASVVVGAEHSGLLELLVTAELERAQRRDHVRVAALLTGTVRPPHGDAPLHTYTLDVSGSGVLVAGAGPVTIGDGVGVTLKLPGDRLLEATGEVARRSRDGHVGLALAGLTHREREALVRFVFERQRHDLRAAREGLR